MPSDTMGDTTLKICRLCLNIVCKNAYEIVEEKLVMVRTIFSNKLNLAVCESPTMCSECLENLQKAFDFKSMCLKTEEHIKTESRDQVDLWQIRIKSEDGEESQDVNKKCRFCLTFNESEMYSQTDEKDLFFMLQKFLPEMDLCTIPASVICRNCFGAFKNFSDFVTRCLDVDNGINTYRNTQGNSSNGTVNLYDVLQLTKIKNECNVEDMYIEQPVFVKSEASVEDKDLEVEQVFIKTEPMELGSENSVENKDVEFGSEIKAPTCGGTPDMAKTKFFSCPQCDFVTKYKRNLKMHITVIHNKTEAKTTNCDQCSYQTFYPARLKTHMRLHMENLPYSCDVCQDEFNDRRHLDNHVVTKHPGSKQAVKTKVHACKLCNFKSVFSTNLSRHIQQVHNKDEAKILTCNKCPYKASNMAQLKVHDCLNSQEVPYECDICRKQYKHRRHLDHHTLTTHPENERAITTKIHTCKFCEFRTVISTYLTKHVLSMHDNKNMKVFKCYQCPYTTDRAYDLKRHVLTHSDTFVCPDCSISFTAKIHLDTHLLLNNHGSSKSELLSISSEVHLCDSCDFKADNSASLDSHIKSHHENDTQLGCPSSTSQD